MRDLTQATKIDNQCALAYFNRAVCYHDSGQVEKALTDYGIVLLLGDQLMLKVCLILYTLHGLSLGYSKYGYNKLLIYYIVHNKLFTTLFNNKLFTILFITNCQSYL